MLKTAIFEFSQDEIGSTLSVPPGTEGMPPMPLPATERFAPVATPSAALVASSTEQAAVPSSSAAKGSKNTFTKVWVSTSLMGCAILGIYAWLR